MNFDFSRILATFNSLQSNTMSATPPTSIMKESELNHKLERCIDCDEPTGRAGKNDDSLYFYDDGPYCEECYDKKYASLSEEDKVNEDRKINSRYAMKLICPRCKAKKGEQCVSGGKPVAAPHTERLNKAKRVYDQVNESFGASAWGDRIQDVWSGIAHDLMAVGGIDGSGARETVNDRLYDAYGDAWRNLPPATRHELLQKYLSDDEVAAAQPEVQDNFESDDFDNEVNFNDNYESDEEIDKWESDREAEEAARVPVPNDEGKYCPNCGEVFDSSKEECRNCHTGLVSMKLSESINKKKVNESICNNCTADGVIPCQACNGHAENDKCSECKGTGEMNCPECNGKGYLIDKKMKKIKEAFKYNDHHLEGADDYCEACFKHVANHECDEGILCDYCYHDIYGGHPNNFDIPAEENEDDSESIDVEEMWPVKESMDECQGCTSGEPEMTDGFNITTSYDSKTNRKSMTITADNEKAEELARIIELSGLNPSITVPPTEEPKQLLLEPETDCVVTESEEDEDDARCYDCGEPLSSDSYYGLCWNCYHDKKHENEKVNEAKSYSIQARKTKTSPLTYLSLTPTKWVSSKDKAFKFDDRESAVTKAASIKGKNELTDIKVIPNLNESKLNEFHAKGHECDFCGNPLSQSDYTAAGKWSYKCGSCGFKYNHGGQTPEAQIRAQLKSGKIDQGDSYSYLDESAEPKRIKHPGVKCSATDCKKTARWRMKDGKMMCDNCKTAKDKKVDESLTPARKSTGLNGAPKAWANEPNEQIAHWRAVCDDTQGLSQPHDMFPNRIGDNPLKVAANKVDKPLHENAKINALAENLSKKFSSITENDAKYTANQLNFKHLESKLANFGYTHSPEEEESGNHSSHVFTRGDGDFITVSKDGKFDWAINDEFGFSKEGTGRTALLQTLTFQKGNPMDSLDTFPEVDSTELSHEDLDDLLDVPDKKKFNACSRCSGTGKVAGLTCSECFGEGTGKWGDEYYD